jgi:hypothetical protein
MSFSSNAFNAFAAPGCSIEIYPYEAPSLFLSPGQFSSVTVRKSLSGDGVGRFDIQMAPGGVKGPDDPVTWSQIITPMSHATIGMSRGSEAAIVMDGITTGAGESQAWRTTSEGMSSAGRGQGIGGADFGWFFRSFNYYALTFLGLTAGTPVGGALDFVPGSLSALLSKGQIGGSSSADSNPVVVGKVWYQIMTDILAKTVIPTGQQQNTFAQILSRSWEKYPNVFIPYSDFFMTGEEAWMDKFQSIFPMPWYEFFVTTASANAYPFLDSGVEQDVGIRSIMRSLPNAPAAGPCLVARINPVPNFDLQNLAAGQTQVPGDIDVSRWNNLPLYDFTQRPFGFIDSSISFSAAGARNFYQLNPTAMSTITASNANSIPFPFLFIAAADPASVQRYGFRPQIGTTRWLFDPQGTTAQNAKLSVQDTVLSLTGKLISYFHPLPLMAQAEVTIPLAPGILIGTRFRYAPFKNGVAWDFYIDGFEHHFTFGGQSATKLTLTRGLPQTVYADAASDGILRAIHVGNAMRQNGVYTVGLPQGAELPLQIVTTSQQATQLTGHLAAAFVTPQTGAS